MNTTEICEKPRSKRGGSQPSMRWLGSDVGSWIASEAARAGRKAPELPDHLRFALMRRKEVEQLCGLSTSTLYARIRAGTFPAPIQLSPTQPAGEAA